MELLALIFAQGLNRELINRIKKIKHLDALIAQKLHLRQVLDGLLVLAGCIINLFLISNHAVNIFLQGDKPALLGSREEQQVLQLIRRIITGIHAVIDADFQ